MRRWTQSCFSRRHADWNKISSSSILSALQTFRRSIFVRFQETPNDSCYKFFVKDVNFLPAGANTMLFDRTNDHQSPLAHAILSALPMVEEVTIGSSFVTVRRVESDNARAAARYFAMKFHGTSSLEDTEESAAARSAALQQRVTDAMLEDEEKPTSAPSSTAPTSAEAPSLDPQGSFEMGGFHIEGGPPEEVIDEAALQAMIEAMNWSELKMLVSALLTDHFSSGEPHISPDAPHPHADTLPQEGDSEIVLMIKELVSTSIRPQLQDDGGDIRFIRFVVEEGVMEVEMLGACRTCKSSKTTLVDLIERTTRHWIPEVKAVKEVMRVSAFDEFSAERRDTYVERKALEDSLNEEAYDASEHADALNANVKKVKFDKAEAESPSFRVVREVNS